MDKVQKRISLIQQPSSEAFIIYPEESHLSFYLNSSLMYAPNSRLMHKYVKPHLDFGTHYVYTEINFINAAPPLSGSVRDPQQSQLV
jgi:hypothetical protein